MAILIQNMACIEVELNPSSRRWYFDEDALPANAIIENVILFFDDPRTNSNFKTRNPFSISINDSNNAITSSANITDNGLYMNLGDAKSEYLSNYYFKNLQSVRGEMSGITILELNKHFDSRKSYFNYEVASTVRFLCLITYRTERTQISTPVITGSFNVEIPLNWDIDFQDIRLSDYIPESYKSKKIKKISTEFGFYAYFYLRSDKHLIENIPCHFFANSNPKTDMFIDMMNIDFTQSFLKFRNINPSQVDKYSFTFYY